MEDKKNPSTVPSDYVTLSQLQERWLKEQRRKQEEKEKEEQRQRENLKNQDFEPNIQPQKLEEGPRNRRIPNWRRNRKLKGSVSGASPEQKCVATLAEAEGNERVTTVNETERKDLGDNEMKKIRKKKKIKKKKSEKDKEKMVKAGEARIEGDGELMVPETHDPPAKREKDNIPTRRYGRRTDVKSVFRPKITAIVEKRVSKVDMVGEVNNLAEESEGYEEIERKLGDLCIRKENDGSETQNSTSNRSNGVYRGYNGIVNLSNTGYRVRNRNVGGNTRYKSYNYGGNRPKGHYTGNYERVNRYSGNGMVWVKKEEVAGGIEGA